MPEETDPPIIENVDQRGKIKGEECGRRAEDKAKCLMCDYYGEKNEAAFNVISRTIEKLGEKVEVRTSNRVPIWVFVVFVGGLTGILGFLNYDSIRRHDQVISSLESHIDKANIVLENSGRVLDRVTHSLNEVALNQQEVMKKIDIKFRRIPRYDNGK